MHLYLLRHADADTPAEEDDARALSEKGVAQAKKVGAFLADRDLRPALILSSPLRRAQETATIVSEAVDVEMRVVAWLASGLQPATGLEEIIALRDHDSLLLSGHEPDFSKLAAYLLGLPTPTALHIRKASLTLLEVEIFKPRAARLEYSIHAN